MMVTRMLTALVLVLLWSSVASAQGRIARDGWEGFWMRGADGKLQQCVLYDRTVEAFNAKPFDMLGLARDGVGRASVLVFYRPRTLTRVDDAAVTLKVDENPPVQARGRVRSDFHVEVPPPLDPALLSALRKGKVLEVTTQRQTIRFDITLASDVLDTLGECVTQNGK